MTTGANKARAIVAELHQSSRHGGGRFELQSPTRPPIETIPGVLYRFRELDREGGLVDLTLYLGTGALGGSLWEQEVRVLERIGSLEHPALPSLTDGGYLPPSDHLPGAAYIRVKAPVDSEPGNDLHLAFAEPARKGLALDYLWQLADALSVLHDARISHRNLWPGTLEVDFVDDELGNVRLTRFEMSSMIANLLSSRAPDRALIDQIRGLYLDQDPRSRVFLAPERLKFCLGQEQRDPVTRVADVFSLGMIGAEWLLGEHVVTGPFDTVEEVRASQKRVRLAVSGSDLAPAVQELLAGMLESNPDSRWEANRATTALSTHLGAVSAATAATDAGNAPHLVVYIPGEDATDLTLTAWGYLDAPTSTEDGRGQLVNLIESDFQQATVYYSSDGAMPYVQPRIKTKDARLEAKTVIVGKDLLWFCAHYYLHSIRGHDVYDHAVVIKYVLERHRSAHVLDDLRAYAPPRRLFRVDAVPKDVADRAWLAEIKDQRPSWRPLTDPPAVHGRQVRQVDRNYLEAMGWYVQYREALLEAREYRFQRRPGEVSDEVVIAWDQEAERARHGKLPPLRHWVVTTNRPSLAMFLDSATEEDASGIQVEVRAGDRSWDESARFWVRGFRGTDEVRLGKEPHQAVPERGVLRLVEDRASRSSVLRQGEALAELSQNPTLLRQLTKPSGIQGRGWEEAGANLQKGGAAAVVAMLQNRTLFALHGPPGTGKTEITSEAIKEFLQSEPWARILVSAQSHEAVDNLAERVLGKLHVNGSNAILALRVGSPTAFREDKVSEAMKKYSEPEALQRLTNSISTSCLNWLRTSATLRPEVAPVVQSWVDVVRDASLDLRLRLRRGANLVFATTGAATRENLVSFGSPEPFDWVIVEEAARAWPTELALPLVRGNRWTLVGDQAQIGPYSRLDVQRFLESGASDPSFEIVEMAGKADTYARVFDTFGSMFDQPVEGVTMTLTQQYRMHKDIAEVVSATFYAESGGLESMRADAQHGLIHPSWLSRRALVWLDTGARQAAEGFWRNPYEVEVVSAFVDAIRGGMERSGRSLAVLTPYRAQRSALASRVGQQHVHTVDGFQGREADVVVASLVRDRIGRTDAAISNVGHLAHGPRINVMLSRARDLLVVVGSYEHYLNHAGPDWENVAIIFKQLGDVIAVEGSGLLP